MNSAGNWKLVAVLVVVDFGLALNHVLFKKALNTGVDRVVVIVYRQCIATGFLIPFVCLYERTSWAVLTARVIGQMFLCALLGMTLTQYLFLVGLDYTTTTFTCAFVNMVPVITFVLALLLGMEKLNMKRNDGRAKVVGTLTCIAGAVMLSFYKGMPLIPNRHDVLNHGRPKRFGLGSIILSTGSVAWSSWFLIQSRIGEKFPYQYSSTMIMSFFSAIQSIVLCLVANKNMSKWILKGEQQILSVVYSGAIGSGLCYAMMSWCVKRRGPVFSAAFSPLIQIFAAIFDVSLLQEQVYLGSVLGSFVVIVGMYVLLWGKNFDKEGGDSDGDGDGDGDHDAACDKIMVLVDAYNGQHAPREDA